MGYINTRQCLDALEARGELVRIDTAVDARIEVGAIQRRVFLAGGPALLFTNVKGCRFPMAANIYGTRERMHFIFRDTIATVRRLMKLKLNPMEALRHPLRYLGAPRTAWHTLPRSVGTGPVMEHETTISALPQLVSWPMDGGGYVTLPQVYTESPDNPGYAGSNMGMYRVQLTGNDFLPDREVGLHYQIHRGIGHHHAQALAKGQPLRVNVFVGGPPAMTLAAVMPLPEGLAELFFAGAMAGHRIPMVSREGGLPIPAQADFCICGMVMPGEQKPEGPFGDHLGYYSLTHDFPVMRVDRVFHRSDAIWPFTTVGRPPQEDTVFGEFIHEMTAELVPSVFSGVHEVHAVDAAGVHPLLLAVGSERYVPYAQDRQPQELLTNAMSLLGNTQTSLSKYVVIAAREDMEPGLSCHDIPAFFGHMLRRVDLTRDLHFITRTTMDTLDYSGISLNQGSKLVLAAAGSPRRTLAAELPSGLDLPRGFRNARVFAPGIMVLKGPAHRRKRDQQDPAFDRLGEILSQVRGIEGFPLIVVADDAGFTAKDWDNFLWVTFTRSDPATDIYGAGAFTNAKHWGATLAVVIDARLKTYHAPPLAPDPEVERRVDALGAPGGPLHGII
ncbi:MAG: UbiD family decarboxylase [Pseudodesulfovibrio sp.]|uniref:UbiD family decarboxylase n=1 Tax=Pseudodesulfovibrio aespoeensis (strain ATCC 700646 / DSM 10631 / Aspo-2) TaxID=643562 RepID=E6VU59_PSEA9|nr:MULTISPECIES: UbiD family decarboxylase [Pseudodesulfovibrio]MBU4243302.1 UbiD family decarboxylase [Pseudomonadota bacterium]ADU62252.1 UbiD family decarboxylase [Pseudodesulfovibrio aespoeensis Aspo-2]MBU4380375.1 UbiD family decarboxylase [Pseudomonadota bacterium]MBU4476614.1 UbiD family decarboxylase [Pseudomonadota bacterium]MBU4515281.1 UbiD family decarboxylase [Pseudomonadota bacterium]